LTGATVPVVFRIPQDHPQRAEILSLLAPLDLPDGLTLMIFERRDGIAGWKLKLTSATRVAACAVEEADGPTSVLVAASRLLAAVGRV
jgi:hypothetical protein